MTQFGRTQLAVQRTLSDPALGNSFVAVTRTQQNSCLKAADRGLLRRDPHQYNRFYATAAGWAALLAYEDALPAMALQRRRKALVAAQRELERNGGL